MRRLSAVAALAVLGSLLWVGSAWACSCAPQAPAESLREADAAIVGRLVKVEARGRFRADYRYEVRRVYRGEGIEPGQMLTVRSGRRAAACALPRRLDHRYGLFLVEGNGHWLGGICGVIEPRRLWHAAEQRPGLYRGSSGQGLGGCSA
jgi:cyanophycinase-like exopeptidase